MLVELGALDNVQNPMSLFRQWMKNEKGVDQQLVEGDASEQLCCTSCLGPLPVGPKKELMVVEMKLEDMQ